MSSRPSDPKLIHQLISVPARPAMAGMLLMLVRLSTAGRLAWRPATHRWLSARRQFPLPIPPSQAPMTGAGQHEHGH
jgi:hypothetical protein